MYKILTALKNKLNDLTEENERQKGAIDNIRMMDNFEKFRLESFQYVTDILNQIRGKHSLKK